MSERGEDAIHCRDGGPEGGNLDYFVGNIR